jgi:glyoxylase-like metal-dependent hydrolase (beta-lactamase superfamily II)
MTSKESAATGFVTPEGWKTGLKEVANGIFAYIQAHGELGVSNAGLITDRQSAMAVDALMVPSMTRRFLSAIKKVTRRPVSRLVNTHHHVDHTGGNSLFKEAEIISHTHCRDEIERTAMPAEAFKQLMPRFASEYDKLKLSVPKVTFEDKLIFHQADRNIELRHLGPAHTFGDAFVYLPKEKVVFAGDLAFYYVTPMAFQGHVGNWIKVADRILKMDVETIVPGHGPVGGKKELRDMRAYLMYIRREAKKRFDDGMPAHEAARDVRLGIYARWREPERILPNVMRLYQEFRDELDQPLNPLEVFEAMRRLRKEMYPHEEDESGMCCV